MIPTIIRHVRNVDIWRGELPLIPEGHRINVEGKSFRVMGSAIILESASPSQLVVVEATRD